jgi:peroxiredoxin
MIWERRAPQESEPQAGAVHAHNDRRSISEGFVIHMLMQNSSNPLQFAAATGLSAGDIAPDWPFSRLDGNRLSIYQDAIAGHPIVFVLCPQYSSENISILDAFTSNFDAFSAADAHVFAVFPNEKSAKRHKTPFPALIDRRKEMVDIFGSGCSSIVLRNNNHVAGIFTGDAGRQVEGALRLTCAIKAEMVTIEMNHRHPPVLLVPDVFSPDDCRRLIEIFDTRGQRFLDPQPAMNYLGTDYKMRVPEHGREDRIDHFFFDKDTIAFLNNRLMRVLPEIVRSFHYRATKYESLRMARYQGSRGGLSHGHRDNTGANTHRRFAMSINLNTEEFKGGALRFPEFGDQRYRPESGTAIVFSSSLLHEAMQVTEGSRLVFLAFLFGDI